MVKAHNSRKSSLCLRRQTAGRMDAEMEEERPRPSSLPQPKRGSPSADPAEPKAQAPAAASPESQEPGCSPQGNPEKGDCSGQTKALWKPIPPLQPQDGPDQATRDQSCQTEERLEDSQDTYSHTPGYCTEPGDPPLLQKPLQTSKSGIQQIIECFRSGTSELKHMLLREVDTIFECKLCRSLFRGLPNLITHREYYCISSPPQPDMDGDDRQSVAVKELVQALYPRKEHPDQVVRLEPIQTTTKAVFQYLTTEEELACRHTPGSWAGEQPMEEEEEEQEEEEPCESESRCGKQSPGPPAGPKRRVEPEKEASKEAGEDQTPPVDEDSSNSGVEDVTISCCLCGKDFNSRQNIRRHCRKMHQTKLEELRKYTETRTIPFSLLSVVKGRPKTLTSPVGAKSCPVCCKTFATKANVRRHFDEVHRGLRRDLITPDIATRPGHPLSLEDTPPRKPGSTPSQSRQQQQQFSMSSSRCVRCKKTYSSQMMLKRHMRIVHKMSVFKKSRGSKLTRSQRTNAKTSTALTATNKVHVKEETMESSEEDEEEEEEQEEQEEQQEEEDEAPEEEETRSRSTPSPGASSEKNLYAAAVATATTRIKAEEAESPASSADSSPAARENASPAPLPVAGAKGAKTPRLSVGFDFKQLFCKLCKRQFSSRQNLTKHIELHTDGNEIFIKFYRCPLCRYESRRKRDVLRHVTVVHKQPSAYLAKIMPKLESRAVKRPAEVVLKNTTKRPGTGAGATASGGSMVKAGMNGRHTPSSSASSSSSSSSSSTSSCSTEVKVTRNFSLHACDQCGRAFAKKLFLDSHKRSHRNAAAAAARAAGVGQPDNRRKGVSTRSKSLLW
ncbi:unnamed protein product [Merluccius merluccius]